MITTPTTALKWRARARPTRKRAIDCPSRPLRPLQGAFACPKLDRSSGPWAAADARCSCVCVYNELHALARLDSAIGRPNANRERNRQPTIARLGPLMEAARTCEAGAQLFRVSRCSCSSKFRRQSRSLPRAQLVASPAGHYAAVALAPNSTRRVRPVWAKLRGTRAQAPTNLHKQHKNLARARVSLVCLVCCLATLKSEAARDWLVPARRRHTPRELRMRARASHRSRGQLGQRRLYSLARNLQAAREAALVAPL